MCVKLTEMNPESLHSSDTMIIWLKIHCDDVEW